MTTRQVLRCLVVVVLTLLVQTTLGLDLRVAGAHPDLMVLLPIAAGLAAGPREGAGVGFAAGIAADLFLPTPFGLSALVYCLVGFAVGFATRAMDRSTWWLAPGAALAASAVAVMLYAVLGAVLGQESMLDTDLGAIVAVVAIVNALLAPVAVRLMRWALGTAGGSRARVAAIGGRW
jgi:rod shape-determining protein MreD